VVAKEVKNSILVAIVIVLTVLVYLCYSRPYQQVLNPAGKASVRFAEIEDGTDGDTNVAAAKKDGMCVSGTRRRAVDYNYLILRSKKRYQSDHPRFFF